MNDVDLAAAIIEPSGTAYALATVDAKTGAWFLMRGSSLGNPMRTRSQVAIMTWSEKSQVLEWLSSLPDQTKREMESRRLFIVKAKLSVFVDEETESVQIASKEIVNEETGMSVREFELGTSPIKRQRKRRST